MKVEFSLQTFPGSEEVKKDCGLPFGVAITPLAENENLVAQPNDGSENFETRIPRCSKCFAYINCYCAFAEDAWICSICKSTNNFSRKEQYRYADLMYDRPLELRSETVDLQWNIPLVQDEDYEDMQAQRFCPDGFPVYIALLDTLCDEDWLDSMKTALTTALDALPSEALFALISFDDKVRLYDLKASLPVCRTVTIVDDLPLLTPLEDILPLQQLLAPVGSNKDIILKTIDLIEHSHGPDLGKFTTGDNLVNAPEQPTVQRSVEDAPCRGQALGTVLQALLQYLQPLRCIHKTKTGGEEVILGAQILTFLTGPPTLGLGSLLGYMTTKYVLATKRKKRKETGGGDRTHPGFLLNEATYAADVETLRTARKPGSEFYSSTALVAASLGVVVNLFVLSKHSTGLELLSSLAVLTGGGIWLYKTSDDAMLTQDLFRCLSTATAQNCLLRVRLPPGLKISKAYGKMLKDPVFDDVFRLLTCDPHHTVCLDFEHTMQEALDSDEQLTIQVAFQYSTPTFISSQTDIDRRFEISRRVRISTVQAVTTTSRTKVYDGVLSEPASALLYHKVLATAETDGYRKAALLLQDWLIILAAGFSKTTGNVFQAKDCFQPLIRFVYGFLRSPLLLDSSSVDDDDQKVFLRHLWSSLPPGDLSLAIYPNLISFWSDSNKGMQHHSLSHKAMEIAEAPIFLLDSFDTIVLYYTANCPKGTVYPPPPGSLIRQTINNLRQKRKLAPKYVTIREDDSAANGFVNRLLDEPLQQNHQLEGESGVVFTGFMNFLEWIKSASEEYLTTLKIT